MTLGQGGKGRFRMRTSKIPQQLKIRHFVHLPIYGRRTENRTGFLNDTNYALGGADAPNSVVRMTSFLTVV